MTHRKIEQENIMIEKEAYMISHCSTASNYKAIKLKEMEDLRLNKAENEDIYERIFDLEDSRPILKTTSTTKNITIPTIATAVLGGIVGAGIVSTGALEPEIAGDLHNTIGMTVAGVSAGGLVGLLNSISNCTKPVTNAVINFKIKKELEKLERNNRKIRASEYLLECLNKEEQKGTAPVVFDMSKMDLSTQDNEDEAQMTLFED